MKKLTLFFLSLLAFGLGFQACDDGKTYAEMLDGEKDGINDFIKKEGIKVISQSEFYAQDSTDNVRDVSSKLTNKIGIGVPIGNYLSQYFANLYPHTTKLIVVTL